MATSTITLFSGADYMNRDTQYDEVFEYSELISFSGDQEFIFEKLTGDSATGTLTVSTQGGELVDVVVNQYGRVNY